MTRRRRRQWLVETFRADVDLVRVEYVSGFVDVGTYVVSVEELRTYEAVVSAEPVPACRCYRCGTLLTVDTVTADRRVPGCKGGTYKRENLRPACLSCNSKAGGGLRS